MTTWPRDLSVIINDYAGPFYFWTQQELDDAQCEAEYQEYLAEEVAKKWMDAEAEHEAAINAIGDSDFEEHDD